jgi:adenylosuccinate lyase
MMYLMNFVKAKINVKEIHQLEELLKHDVIAFVESTSKTVSNHGSGYIMV